MPIYELLDELKRISQHLAAPAWEKGSRVKGRQLLASLIETIEAECQAADDHWCEVEAARRAGEAMADLPW